MKHLHIYMYQKQIGWHVESFLNWKTNYRTLSIIVSTLVNQLFVVATTCIFICWHSFIWHGIIRVSKLDLIEEMSQVRDCSAAGVQFSFRNWANFHSRISWLPQCLILFLLAPCHFFVGALTFSSWPVATFSSFCTKTDLIILQINKQSKALKLQTGENHN